MPASITLTVAHLPTSVSFFLSTLQPLNYVYRGRVNDTIGFGHPDAAPDFWITQSIPGVPPGPAHVAFPATSRSNVHDFFHAALRAGGKVHGEPALRDECGYYSAAVIDLDGNSIEAVFRPDLLEASQENAASGKTVVSMTKSTANSKAPTTVSSATKAKSTAPSKVASVAPSAAKSNASSSSSKAPSKVASVAPSKAGSVSPSQVRSVAPVQSVAISSAEAPARTTISRAPTAPAAVQTTAPGTNFVDIINEARGTVNFARELVDQARPMMQTTTAAMNTNPSVDSHGPSDAIVGTLLGVAAGAALHYAFTNRNKATEVASAPVTPPAGVQYVYPTARSETTPSYTDQRYYYYHSQPALPAPSQAGTQRPYAIEPAGSEYSSSSRGSIPQGQKLLEMADNNPTLSDIGAGASTIRPRRRSSFSGVSAPRTTASRKSTKLLESAAPPPTSYRGPTVMTQATGIASAVSATKSRRGSRAGGGADEGYASATDERDRKSRVSSVKSRVRSSSASRHSSHSHSSKTVITAVRTPEQTPLPASRAATQIDERDERSVHSRANKTVIGRLTAGQLAKLEGGGRGSDLTRSVIGKVKEAERVDVSGREVRPEDSVSQVSSSRGSRRRGH